MRRMSELFQDMANSLLRYGLPNASAELEADCMGWKKAPLRIPFGLDFATWHRVARRRLLEDDCAGPLI